MLRVIWPLLLGVAFAACEGDSTPVMPDAGLPDALADADTVDADLADAAVDASLDAAAVPDIGGSFLLSMLTLAQTTQFVAEAAVDGSGEVTLSLTPLSIDDRLPVGATATSTGTVDDSGLVDVPFLSFVLPAEANPITHSTLTLNVTLHTQIESADRFCGSATGHVVRTGTPLDGTTWAAIRIVPGTTGDDLPAPETSCTSP